MKRKKCSRNKKCKKNSIKQCNSIDQSGVYKLQKKKLAKDINVNLTCKASYETVKTKYQSKTEYIRQPSNVSLMTENLMKKKKVLVNRVLNKLSYRQMALTDSIRRISYKSWDTMEEHLDINRIPIICSSEKLQKNNPIEEKGIKDSLSGLSNSKNSALKASTCSIKEVQNSYTPIEEKGIKDSLSGLFDSENSALKASTCSIKEVQNSYTPIEEKGIKDSLSSLFDSENNTSKASIVSDALILNTSHVEDIDLKELLKNCSSNSCNSLNKNCYTDQNLSKKFAELGDIIRLRNTKVDTGSECLRKKFKCQSQARKTLILKNKKDSGRTINVHQLKKNLANKCIIGQKNRKAKEIAEMDISDDQKAKRLQELDSFYDKVLKDAEDQRPSLTISRKPGVDHRIHPNSYPSIRDRNEIYTSLSSYYMAENTRTENRYLQPGLLGRTIYMNNENTIDRGNYNRRKDNYNQNNNLSQDNYSYRNNTFADDNHFSYNSTRNTLGLNNRYSYNNQSQMFQHIHYYNPNDHGRTLERQPVYQPVAPNFSSNLFSYSYNNHEQRFQPIHPENIYLQNYNRSNESRTLDRQSAFQPVAPTSSSNLFSYSYSNQKSRYPLYYISYPIYPYTGPTIYYFRYKNGKYLQYKTSLPFNLVLCQYRMDLVSCNSLYTFDLDEVIDKKSEHPFAAYMKDTTDVLHPLGEPLISNTIDGQITEVNGNVSIANSTNQIENSHPVDIVELNAYLDRLDAQIEVYNPTIATNNNNLLQTSTPDLAISSINVLEVEDNLNSQLHEISNPEAESEHSENAFNDDFKQDKTEESIIKQRAKNQNLNVDYLSVADGTLQTQKLMYTKSSDFNDTVDYKPNDSLEKENGCNF